MPPAIHLDRLLVVGECQDKSNFAVNYPDSPIYDYFVIQVVFVNLEPSFMGLKAHSPVLGEHFHHFFSAFLAHFIPRPGRPGLPWLAMRRPGRRGPQLRSATWNC